MNDFKELLSGTFCIAVTRTPTYEWRRKGEHVNQVAVSTGSGDPFHGSIGLTF